MNQVLRKYTLTYSVTRAGSEPFTRTEVVELPEGKNVVGESTSKLISPPSTETVIKQELLLERICD